MKYIIAVIQPHRLDTVRQALAAIGVQGLDGDRGARISAGRRGKARFIAGRNTP